MSEDPVITDPICPVCRTTNNVRVLANGWLFRCDPCNWEFGHPQQYSRLAAQDVLAKAREAGL